MPRFLTLQKNGSLGNHANATPASGDRCSLRSNPVSPMSRLGDAASCLGRDGLMRRIDRLSSTLGERQGEIVLGLRVALLSGFTQPFNASLGVRWQAPGDAGHVQY